MNVAVTGDALVVTPDKRQRGELVEHMLTMGLKLPRRYTEQLFYEQRVRMGGDLASPDGIVQAGQKIRLEGGILDEYGLQFGLNGAVSASAENSLLQPNEMGTEGSWRPPLDILYEDEHLLVVNKPANLLIYPGSDSDWDSLGHRVAQYYIQQGLQRRVYHVHRLDKDTSGAVLYAKHAYSARALDVLLAEHKIGRRYVALIGGRLRPAMGTVVAPIGRDRHVSGRYRISPTGKPAITHYESLASCRVANDTVTLVECELETGRTHQIRVHMSSQGCPVIGDRLYGGGDGIGPIRFECGQALHARTLTFAHPYQGREVEVSAPLPEEFRLALLQLGLGTFE